MSQFNAPTYDIQKTSGVCAITGRALEPEEAYMATLVEEGEELVRKDICMEAWDEGKVPAGIFSYWRTVVPKPEEKKRMFVDDEVLMNLLRRLADAEQAQRIAFRFVLMLILMRKKLLRYDRTEQREGEIEIRREVVQDAEAAGCEGEAEVAGGDVEGEETAKEVLVGRKMVMQDWWILTPKLDLSKGPMGKWNEDETMEVLDPHLDEQGIRQVTEQLGQILQAEL